MRAFADSKTYGRLKNFWVLILIYLCLAGTVSATDITWTGGSGDWSGVNSKWSGGDPYGNNVFIDGGKTGTTSNVLLNISTQVANLTIDSGDSLGGAGSIYSTNLIDNRGIIVANQSAGLLINITGLTNTGTLRADGGMLSLYFGTITNTGGTIEARNGSAVSLQNTTIVGGNLSASNSGLITVQTGWSATLNGVTLTTGSLLNAENGASTYLVDTFTNNGTIALNSSGAATRLYMSGSNVTLGGTGAVNMSNNISNAIEGSSNNFTIGSGQTIQGAGKFNNFNSIVNQGIIVASGSAGLTFNMNANTSVTNNGIFQVNAGSTMNVNNGLNNYSSNTLTGGTYKVYGTAGNAGNMRLANANIVTNAATILLDGPNSNLLRDDTGTDALTAFTTNAAAGHFTIQNGRNFDNSGAFSNAGIVTIGNSSTFTVSGIPTNSGELQLRGGTFAAITGLTNSGNTNGFGIVQPLITNTGSVIAAGGTLTANTGISGTTGTVQTNAGGTLAISLSSTAGTLINNGNLSFGTNNFAVYSDYQNANFGTGNSFNARAHVSGTGLITGNNASQTITATGNPTKLSGGPNTWTLDLGNVRGGTSQALNYQIANNGTGASIRGAVQTGAPGLGNITDSRLSGAGVTASNFGPIAAAGNSGNLGVTFNATSGGPLTGQSIAVVSNFSNVTTQIINLSGMASALAVGNATPNTPQNLGNFHVAAGPNPSQNFNVTNTTPSSAWAEQLGIASAIASGNFSATNNLGSGLIAGGATSNNAVTIQVSGGVAGINNGNLAIQYLTNGTNIDPSFVSQNANLQNISLQATGYNLAQGSATPASPINIANQRISGTNAQPLTISNTAPAGSYTEVLNAGFGANTGNATNNGGSITGGLGAGGIPVGTPNSTAMSVGVDTSAAGLRSGTVTVNYSSNGTGTSGLGITNLPSQTQIFTVQGNVYRLATASGHTPEPVVIGNQRVGGSLTQALSLTNTAANDGFSEGINASIGGATAGVTATGSFSLLGAGATNNTSLLVGVDTTTAGAKSGTATITLQSDGTGTSGFSALGIGTQTVNVSGNVYLQAQPNFASTNINLGYVHVGGTAQQALSVSNTNVAAGFQEGLNASFTGSTAGITTSGGPITNLAAGAPANTSLVVGINTSAAGNVSGTATVGLVSNGTVSGLSNLTLGSQTVNVSGNVIALASPLLTGTLDFGAIVVNSGPVQRTISVSNLLSAPNASFQELLNATFGTLTNTGVGSYGTSGSVTGLLAGAPANTNMVVTFTPGGTAGAISGNVQIQLVSDGTSFGLGTTSLGSQPVTFTGSVTGLLFNQAQGSATPTTVNAGNIRINTAVNQILTITNTAPAGPLTEGLNASFGANTGNVTNNGGTIISLAGGASNNTNMGVSLNTSAAGVRSGTATVNFQTDGSISQTPPSSVGSQVINVTGNVYRLANPTLNTPTVNLAARVGDASPSANISVTNSSPDIFTEGLNVMRGATAAGFTSSGSITNLVAQGTSTNAIQVALNTGTAGTFSGTQALNFISTGTGTTGAPDISVGSGGVALNGKVYTPAVAQVANTTVDFGIVHVGDTVGAKALTVTNAAPATALNDVLKGSIGGGTGPFSATGNLGAGLGAGNTDTKSLSVGLNTLTAGIFGGTASINFLSHNPDMFDLPLPGVNISLTAQVNNFADAIFEKVSGIGIFTQVSLNEFSLDFGQLSIGSGLFEAQLGVRNDASAPADTLGGGFDLNAPNFILSGFSAFDGIEAGNLLSGLEVGFNANALGDYNGLILLHPFGYNSSGFNGTLPDIALNLQAEVVSGQPVPEPSTWILLVTGLGTLGWIRRMRKMSRGE